MQATREIAGIILRQEIHAVNTGMIGASVPIQFKGDEAYTDYKSIVIPYIAPTTTYPDKEAKVLRGYANHETGHILYTNPYAVSNQLTKRVSKEFGEAFKRVRDGKYTKEDELLLTGKKVVKGQKSEEEYLFFLIAKKIDNCCEDWRLERNMRRNYPGTFKNLNSTRTHVNLREKSINLQTLQSGQKPKPGTSVGQLITYLGCMENDYLCAMTARENYNIVKQYAPEDAKLIEEFWPRIIACETSDELTAEAFNLTAEIIRRFRKEIPDQEDKNKNDQDSKNDQKNQNNEQDQKQDPDTKNHDNSESGENKDPSDKNKEDQNSSEESSNSQDEGADETSGEPSDEPSDQNSNEKSNEPSNQTSGESCDEKPDEKSNDNNSKNDANQNNIDESNDIDENQKKAKGNGAGDGKEEENSDEESQTGAGGIGDGQSGDDDDKNGRGEGVSDQDKDAEKSSSDNNPNEKPDEGGADGKNQSEKSDAKDNANSKNPEKSQSEKGESNNTTNAPQDESDDQNENQKNPNSGKPQNNSNPNAIEISDFEADQNSLDISDVIKKIVEISNKSADKSEEKEIGIGGSEALKEVLRSKIRIDANTANINFRESIERSGINVGRLSQTLRKILMGNVLKLTYRNREDGVLDMKNVMGILNKSNTIYKKTKKMPRKRSAIYFCLDHSASMLNPLFPKNAPVAQLEKATCALVKAIGTNPDVSIAIANYTSCAVTQKTKVTILKDFNDSPAVARIAAGGITQDGAYHGTPTAYALMECYRDIHYRDEDNKVIILITDGVPSNQKLADEAAQTIRKKGVKLIGIGLETGFGAPHPMDFDGWTQIKDLSEISEKLAEIVKKQIS